uniref:(northern house mosquito) hypothetical protein n=1 Tax=Culex pipiens TaxID=7175 RepID=A0A8D8MQ97_CULPI
MTNEQKTLFSAVITLKFSRIVFPSIRLPFAHTHHTKLGQFSSARKKRRKRIVHIHKLLQFPFQLNGERTNKPVHRRPSWVFPISVHKFTQICRTFFQRA